MSSRNILFNSVLTNPNEKNVIEPPKNDKNYNICQTYLKENKKEFIDQCYSYFDSKTIQKIDNINNYLKTNWFQQNINRFGYVYKRLIHPLVNENDQIFRYNEKHIENRLKTFFSQQKYINNIKNIKSLIEYQFTYIKNIYDYLFVLVTKNHYFLFYNEFQIEKKFNIEPIHTEFVNDYYEKFNNIKFIIKNKKINPTLSPTDSHILIILTKIFQNIVIKLQKKHINQIENEIEKINPKHKENATNIITYGSYSLHQINSEIKFNDVDIYHSNPQKLLIVIMLMIEILFGIKTNILKIPFILGHLSLRYKEYHFSDCIYLDEYTINQLTTQNIKNTIILDSTIQTLNYFRMMCDFSRINNSQKNINQQKLKLATLIEVLSKKENINFNELKPISIKETIINEKFLVFDLKEILLNFGIKEKDMTNLLEFESLIVCLLSPKEYLEMLKDQKNILISRQFFGLFNEIVVEYYHNNNDILKNPNKTGGADYNSDYGSTSDESVNTKYIDSSSEDEFEQINVSQIPIFENVETSKFPDVNNNTLIFSSFSTDTYIKFTTNDEKNVIDKSLSDISKETIFSSLVLYFYLQQKNEKIKNVYLKILLSFIKYNKKKEEYNQFFSQKKTFSNQMIYQHKKNKITGPHLNFSIYPFNLKNIFFYKNQTQNYYTYNSFIKLTNYNN